MVSHQNASQAIKDSLDVPGNAPFDQSFMLSSPTLERKSWLRLGARAQSRAKGRAEPNVAEPTFGFGSLEPACKLNRAEFKKCLDEGFIDYTFRLLNAYFIN